VIIRKTFTLLALFALTMEIRSQDFHFSGFMQNMVYVNPGYTALPASGEVGLTYRNQWPGIAATFVTYGAYLVVPVKKLNSGIGISATNDVQGGGVINQTSVGLLYGYLIKLDRNWQVGAGLYASWNMKRFNANELVFRSDILNDLGYGYGNTIYPNYTRSYPDFSVGFIARNHERLSFGFSASHLTQPAYTSDVEINKRLSIKYTAFVSGVIGDVRGRPKFILEPAAFYSFQGHNQELIWGTAINMSSKFMVGGWMRHNLTFHFDALIVSAGISWEKYNITYNYDVNLKKINFMSTKMAAHEVTFLYRFEYKDEHRVKRFGKSECPAY
jgi:type IX secretion system PorP/SprF family membrane protein